MIYGWQLAGEEEALLQDFLLKCNCVVVGGFEDLVQLAVSVLAVDDAIADGKQQAHLYTQVMSLKPRRHEAS